MEKVEEEQREKVSGNDNKLFTARELASKQALTLGADSAVDSGAAEGQSSRPGCSKTHCSDAFCASFCAAFSICFCFAFLFAIGASIVRRHCGAS